MSASLQRCDRAPRVTAGATDVLWHTDEANQRLIALGLNLMAIGMIAGILLSTPTMSAYLLGVVPEANSVGLWQASGLTLATVVGTRLEAVFVISTTTVGRLSAALPTWVIVVSASLLVRQRQLELET